jgi:hypothetical protein
MSAPALIGADLAMLAQVRDRYLVLVTDVIDRHHVVALRPATTSTDDGVVELPPVEVAVLAELYADGLVQVGRLPHDLPWYGGQTAHGRGLLLTTKGRAALDTHVAPTLEVAA